MPDSCGQVQRVPDFVLASASPRRLRLLRARGLSFIAAPSGVAELEPGGHPHLSPGELAAANAFRKAAAVAEGHPGRWVVGCDTVVALGTTIFGKPADAAAARAMLRHLSGRVHAVTSAVAIVRILPPHRHIHAFRETTLVRFHPLSDRAIEAYLERVHVLDKAGAYALQEDGDRIVRAIRGSADTVIGLPVVRLLRKLEGLRPTGC